MRSVLTILMALPALAQTPSDLLQRGMERFQAGQIEASVQDFDRVAEMDPQALPQLWQRGIALYYLGRYKDCKTQFEKHRTVNPDDVENAAWHYLCTARAESPTAARKVLIPIAGDGRVPMMTVHALYAGKATQEDVLREARNPDARFYANLYIGLYWEANGEQAKADPFLKLAAEAPQGQDYMRAVARVHWARLQQQKKKPSK